jgi:YNFM family putative membrane transporter
MGIFTYLPYLLSGPPYRLSTALVSSTYLVYAAGVPMSALAGRFSGPVAPRRLVGLGLLAAGFGMALTLAGSLPLVLGGLVVVVLGHFTAVAVLPAVVNATAQEAKGSASGLYLSAYYMGGTLGSVLPGLAWEAWGWTGVVAGCAAALAVAFAANATASVATGRRSAAP